MPARPSSSSSSASGAVGREPPGDVAEHAAAHLGRDVRDEPVDRHARVGGARAQPWWSPPGSRRRRAPAGQLLGDLRELGGLVAEHDHVGAVGELGVVGDRPAAQLVGQGARLRAVDVARPAPARRCRARAPTPCSLRLSARASSPRDSIGGARSPAGDLERPALCLPEVVSTAIGGGPPRAVISLAKTLLSDATRRIAAVLTVGAARRARTAVPRHRAGHRPVAHAIRRSSARGARRSTSASRRSTAWCCRTAGCCCSPIRSRRSAATPTSGIRPAAARRT